MSEMLRIEGVEKGYNRGKPSEVIVLRGASLTVARGEVVALVAPSGAGKSTLLHILGCLDQPTAGSYRFGTEETAHLNEANLSLLRRDQIGFIFQFFHLVPRLTAAGMATNERVWRMPLGKEYDKMIDSKFADMKNTGGRSAGSITAAQFLHRFVKDTPWAHIDIAGTAMGSPADEINQSWGSGFGVRLLDELVRAQYES